MLPSQRRIPVKRAKGQTIIPIPMLTTAIIQVVESFSATEEEMKPRMIANMLAAIEKKHE
jgi:hypothetical protein